jgi:hypothetical protein
VLVAHAYAGAVISASVNERVRALVFAAALTPDEGETVAELFYRAPPHADAPQLAPDANGLIWMPEASFAKAFAQHASAEQAALLRPRSGPSRYSAFRSARRRRRGRRSRRGSSSPRKIA